MSSSSQNYFCSSVGKKQVMAVTGLLLCGFLVSHLLGNFLILLGSDAFNTYAHTLTSNKLIYVAEAILAIVLLSHVIMAVRLRIENKLARPVPYLMRRKTGNGETFASSTMIFSGALILVFLVTHLIHFKYGAYYTTNVDGVEMRDLYKVVIEYFRNPLYTAWYVVAMTVIGLHTSHGFWSAFQSLGLSHPKYTPKIKLISKIYAVFIAVGFSSLAIFCHLQN